MVVWDNIDTVLLDMDGTLLDLNYDNFFWQVYLPGKWGALYDLDPVVARDRLIPKFNSKKGTLSWYCLDYWSEELNIDVFALNTDLEDLIEIRPYAEQFLLFLNSLGKQVVLVTNAHQKLLTLKMERTGIDRYFDQIVCAHALGAAKEEPAFWHRLNEEIDFVPERTILIDDSLTVLRTARDYGLSYLLTIERPDSQRPARDSAEFTAITSFEGLFNPDISTA